MTYRTEILRNKSGYRIKHAPVGLERSDLSLEGDEVPQGDSLTVAYRLPSIEERFAAYDAAGAAREAFYDDEHPDNDYGFYDDDIYDDLPEEGLSPHEDPSSIHITGPQAEALKKAPKKPAKAGEKKPAAKAADNEPPSSEGVVPPPKRGGGRGGGP